MQKERIRKTCFYCGEKLTDGGMEPRQVLPARGGYAPRVCKKCYEKHERPLEKALANLAKDLREE